ncbi:MAG: methionine adenosyltransferase, partial [Sphingomonas sp.]|nr:methionine adenosyltransferase [Sphingomonas sp.]
MRSSYLFTSESVSEGHPDKVADQISDAIVDLFLGKDPEARVACETLVTTQRIVIGGEIRCRPVYDEEKFRDTHGWAPGARDEIEKIVRTTVRDIGYEQEGFHWETASFENHLHGQSSEIAQGVDAAGNKDEGA